MGFGGGGGDTTISNEEPRINNLRIQTSAYGAVIPLVWGMTRITGNLMWFSDFTAIPHTTSQTSGGGGGKGGGGGGSVTQTTTTYTYTAAMMLGLCAGEVSAINTVWKDKEKTTLSALGLTRFNGAASQSVWGHLTSHHPSEALSYRGTAYVASAALDLGSGASIPLLGYEVVARGAVPGYGYDALPSSVITDVVTDPVLGAGLPSGMLYSLTDYNNYCIAAGFVVSPAYTEQSQAQIHLKQLMDATNSDVVWSEGKIKIVPYGDQALTGAWGNWTPNLTPQYDLTDDHFLMEDGDEDGPVLCTRGTPADAYNQVQVEYFDRTADYNVSIVEAKDQANIELYGLRSESPQSLHLVCRKQMAQDLADLRLRRKLYVRNLYEFRLSWKFCRLEPMDLVTLTDSVLGLNQQLVRILEVEEDEWGTLSFKAEEMLVGTSAPAAIALPDSGGYIVDFNVAPGNTNTPTIFEPPISLAGEPQIWMAASGGQYWGGCEVWVSLDNASYERVGVLSGRSRHGVLGATLATGSDPDVVNTLKADLTASMGTLQGCTTQERDLYVTLCYVDGELISFQNATLTSAYNYDLTSLRRGAYGTPISSHTAGTKFARLDQAIFKFGYTPDMIGKLVYIKLAAFNIHGAATQDLSALTPVTYTIQGAPLGGVAGLALEQPFTGLSCKVKWNPYGSAGSFTYKVEVYAGVVLKRTVTGIVDPRYEYTFEDAVADGGPFRDLEFRVYAVSETGESSSAAVQAASNPQHAAPSGVTVSAALTTISIIATRPTTADYAGTIICMDTTSGFTPGPTNEIYRGRDNYYNKMGLTGGPYYVRVAHFDVYGDSNLNWSAEYSASPQAQGGGVEIVAALPGTGNYEGRIVYLTTDDKLYRYTGSAWTAATAATDITGTIVESQINSNAITSDKIVAGAVTAAKISVTTLAAINANLGSITAGNMTLDASGFIRGGQTAYDTGSGFWLGYNSTAYKLSIGNASGNKMTWDGSALTIVGVISGGSININNKFTVDSSGNVTIKSATTGARLEIYNNVIKVYDANGILRVKLGDLSA